MKKTLLPLTLATIVAASFLTGCTTPAINTDKLDIPQAGGPTSIKIFAAATISSGTIGTCPGTYSGFVSYTKTVASGWGWVPDTNNTTVFTAADCGGRSDTKVVYLGKNNDTDCGAKSVTVPNLPVSAKYRFTIYFPNNVPTTNYPIVLTGFLP